MTTTGQFATQSDSHPARTVGIIVLLAAITALVLMAFYSIGTASAQGAAPSPLDTDPGGFLEESFAAARSGDWTAVTAAVLIAIVWVARKSWALGRWAFFKTDRGGVIMAFGLALIGGYGHAVAATHDLTPDFATLKAVAMTALTAIGGYVGLRRLIWPPDKTPAATPAPATPPA